MLSKETFVKTIDLIIDQRKKQDALCDALEACSPGCYCDAFVYSKYEENTVNILKEDMNDIDDLIGYFLYDLPNFTAQERDDILAENPEMKNAETLYDYLVKKAADLAAEKGKKE